MTVDDLTTAFHQLSSRVDRVEQFAGGIHGAVVINAQLLFEVTVRLQRVELLAAATVSRTDKVEG